MLFDTVMPLTAQYYTHTLNVSVSTYLRELEMCVCVHDLRARKVLRSRTAANKPSKFQLIMCVRFIPNDLKH